MPQPHFIAWLLIFIVDSASLSNALVRSQSLPLVWRKSQEIPGKSETKKDGRSCKQN